MSESRSIGANQSLTLPSRSPVHTRIDILPLLMKVVEVIDKIGQRSGCEFEKASTGFKSKFVVGFIAPG